MRLRSNAGTRAFLLTALAALMLFGAWGCDDKSTPKGNVNNNNDNLNNNNNNNQTNLPQVSWSTAEQTVGEADGTVTLTAVLTASATEEVTVPFNVGGTADSADHDLVAGDVVIPAGQSTAELQVTITDDTEEESEETVVVTMEEPTNAVLSTPSVHTILIADDDGGSVEVTSPNGGEVWNVGDTHTVTWTSSGLGTVDIHYSTNDGGAWRPIALGVTDNGSYDWLVADTPSLDALVRVRAELGSASDVSDATFTIASTAPVIYVDANATGAGDGSSWADAYTTIQEGAAAAVAGDEVWVAASTYIRQSGDTLLTLPAGVSFFGGFAGGETNRGERDPWLNQTILDGQADTCLVVDSPSGGTLDGFVIQGGDTSPGGTYCGGNAAGIEHAAGDLVIRGCTIRDNHGYNGGAILADGGTVTIDSCLIHDNSAEVFAGAMFVNGAPVDVTNSVVAFNITEGAFPGVIDGSGGPLLIHNTIFWENDALAADIGEDLAATVSHTIISPHTTFTDDGGNFYANPNFADEAARDFHLLQASPAIDAADGDAAPPVDAVGDGRTDDPGMPNTGIGNPAFADIGAYEFGGDTVLRLVSPNGGEVWQVGSSVDVTWEASGPSQARIELSTDGGATWTEIVGDANATAGSYTWPSVSGPGASKVLVRISDAADPSTYDISDRPFSIESTEAWHVDGSAPAGGDGTSWATAFQTVQEAVGAASYGDEIRVAQGTYTRQGTDTSVLVMREGIDMYGGYPSGGGTRDPAANPTVLDGQSLTAHVVVAETATLDGFIIENGLADGTVSSFGAGVLIENVSPVINDCVIRNNEVDPTLGGSGGGVYVTGNLASPVITNTLIQNNFARGYGGGAHVGGDAHARFEGCEVTGNTGGSNLVGGGIGVRGFAYVEIVDSTFSGNTAYFGGGASFTNVAEGSFVTGCIFEGNTSAAWGGGLYISNTSLDVTDTRLVQNTATQRAGGAVLSGQGYSSTFTSCIFDRNQSADGGAIFARQTSSATLTNCTLSGNDAQTGVGGGVVIEDGTLEVQNSILWGNTASGGDPQISSNAQSTVVVEHSDVAGWTGGTGNIDADPLFVDAATGDLHLQPTSPCIDAGNGDIAPANDIDSQPRVDVGGVTNTGTGTPPYTDMGALEHQP